jgi:hypothetical protein
LFGLMPAWWMRVRAGSGVPSSRAACVPSRARDTAEEDGGGRCERAASAGLALAF